MTRIRNFVSDNRYNTFGGIQHIVWTLKKEKLHEQFAAFPKSRKIQSRLQKREKVQEKL